MPDIADAARSALPEGFTFRGIQSFMTPGKYQHPRFSKKVKRLINKKLSRHCLGVKGPATNFYRTTGAEAVCTDPERQSTRQWGVNPNVGLNVEH